ncbi:hypothetical protein HYS79_02760 [Patescibacteria group bacterium]|nr:hypothetical protein [Patescibacteria group bacterium]
MQYQEKKFTIPKLKGISAESIKQHLGLYAGYVKNFNAMTALAGELMKDSEKNAPAIAELMRRRSFEFGGMRLHELYFPQFEGGPKALSRDSMLGQVLKQQYNDSDYCLEEMRHVAGMRGPGWALLYFDQEAKQFLVGWSSEQHIGHFATLPIIVALDVWEHAFVLDYGAAGKGKYIDAFFENLNWSVCERRFADTQK